jgi:hypothetical protein
MIPAGRAYTLSDFARQGLVRPTWTLKSSNKPFITETSIESVYYILIEALTFNIVKLYAFRPYFDQQ